jgi:hypothetical protein
MNYFYRNLVNIPMINCNLNLLQSRFNLRSDKYMHKVFDNENHLWLSPAFESWLKNFNLYIPRLEIFHTESNRMTGWHTDMNPPTDWVKINWVYEEGVSHMEWAELNVSGPLKSLPSVAGTSYVRFEPETTKTACRHNLKGPTLINVGKPHRIDNRKNTDRWCLSCILWHTDKKCRVSWKDAVEIFKDYLK